MSSVIDRINSTSSSNESVCSTSSLNHSYTRQLPSQPPSQISSASAQLNKMLQNSGAPMQQTSNSNTNTLPYMEYSNNSTTNKSPNNYDTSQSYMPKKTQRTKDITRQRYNSPRENV